MKGQDSGIHQASVEGSPRHRAAPRSARSPCSCPPAPRRSRAGRRKRSTAAASLPCEGRTQQARRDCMILQAGLTQGWMHEPRVSCMENMSRMQTNVHVSFQDTCTFVYLSFRMTARRAAAPAPREWPSTVTLKPASDKPYLQNSRVSPIPWASMQRLEGIAHSLCVQGKSGTSAMQASLSASQLAALRMPLCTRCPLSPNSCACHTHTHAISAAHGFSLAVLQSQDGCHDTRRHSPAQLKVHVQAYHGPPNRMQHAAAQRVSFNSAVCQIRRAQRAAR